MQPLPANRPLIAAARTASEPTFFPCIAHLFRLRNYLGEKRFSHLFFSSSGIYLTNVSLLLRSKNWKASPTLNRGVTTFDLLTYARAEDVRRGEWKRIRLEEDPTCNPSAIDQASRRKPYARGNVVWHEERVTFSFHDHRRVVSFLYFAELDCYHF